MTFNIEPITNTSGHILRCGFLKNPPARRHKKPQKQLDQRALASPVLTYDGNAFSRSNAEIDVRQCRTTASRIDERDVLEEDPCS